MPVTTGKAILEIETKALGQTHRKSKAIVLSIVEGPEWEKLRARNAREGVKAIDDYRGSGVSQSKSGLKPTECSCPKEASIAIKNTLEVS
jgi:hypothetical protein